MFVRNNTKCPSCGRNACTDIYYIEAGFTSSGMTIRAECHDCLSFVDVIVDYRVVRMWLRTLATTAMGGTDESLRSARHWSDDAYLRLSQQQIRSIVRLAKSWFAPGVAYLEVIDLPALCEINRKLRASNGTIGGDGIQALVNAWCGL